MLRTWRDLRMIIEMLIKKISRKIDETWLGVHKRIWGLMNDYSPNALPVYVVGAQRSGTNMFGECLNRSLDVEYYPEKSPIAFDNFHLRDDGLIQELIRSSRHRYVVFKPLKDSHRVDDILRLAGHGRALWMYRRYQDRANSAVHRFGAHNLEVLRDITQGRNLDVWQVQGLVSEDLELVRGFDYTSMKPEAAASLFWYLRNKLFFNQGLDRRADVFLVCYEELVSNPESVMRGVCRFLECDFQPAMIRHIFSTSLGRYQATNVGSVIRGLCDGMYQKLSAVRADKERHLA